MCKGGPRRGESRNTLEGEFRPVFVAVCMLPALLGWRLWPALPTRVVLIWAEGAEVSRGVFCFGFPLLLALLQGLAYLLARRGRYADAGIERIRQAAAKWFLPAVSVVVLSRSLLEAAGVPLPVHFWVLSAAGGLLLWRGGRPVDGHSWRSAQTYDVAGLLLLLCEMLAVPAP